MSYSHRTLGPLGFIVAVSAVLLSSCTGKDTPPSVSDFVPVRTVTVWSELVSTWIVSSGTLGWNTFQYETIHGIQVPPEPDPVLNDSTLAGVDVNANGVRDDVERYIARNTSSKEDFNIAISYGRFLCQLSSFPTTGTIEDVAGVANIVTSTNNADIDRLKNKLSPEFFANLSKKILNTKDRDARYNKVSSFMFNPESAVEAKKCIPASTVFDISIPPEPNIAENNDTILWLDSNNNWVRDDVERVIACNVINANDYLASLEIAKAYWKMLSFSGDTIPDDKMIDFWGDIACAEDTIDFSKYTKWAYSPERDITRTLLNTEDRLSLYRKKTSHFWWFVSDELKHCAIKSYSPYITK